MCGIAGFSRVEGRTSSIRNGATFAVDLAHSIRNRGTDAVGFGWFNPTGEAWYWKDEGDPYERAVEARLPRGLKTLIAHTRAATQGPPSVNANNHPVIAPGIVLVHNGGVFNDRELMSSVGYEPQAEVDSEALAALLSYGPEAFTPEHPADLLSLVEGSAAIAWLDTSQPDVLHLARVSQRPLAMARTRRGDIVFGSTPENLRMAAAWSDTMLMDVTTFAEGDYVAVKYAEVVERRTFTPPAPRYRQTTWAYGAGVGPARHANTERGNTKGKSKHRRGGTSSKPYTPIVDRIGAIQRYLDGNGPDPYAGTNVSPLLKPEGRARWSTKRQSWVTDDKDAR
jgi:glucosamine 6-phosphate synthetase-like amidotransferase/phosphosugar isomerase protein